MSGILNADIVKVTGGTGGGGSGGSGIQLSATAADATTDYPLFYNNSEAKARKAANLGVQLQPTDLETLLNASPTIIALQASSVKGRLTR